MTRPWVATWKDAWAKEVQSVPRSRIWYRGLVHLAIPIDWRGAHDYPWQAAEVTYKAACDETLTCVYTKLEYEREGTREITCLACISC